MTNQVRMTKSEEVQRGGVPARWGVGTSGLFRISSFAIWICQPKSLETILLKRSKAASRFSRSIERVGSWNFGIVSDFVIRHMDLSAEEFGNDPPEEVKSGQSFQPFDRDRKSTRL